MQLYGLVGEKLGHSFSPRYFADKFRKLGINAEYRLFELKDVKEILNLISGNTQLTGLNVTVPFKQPVIAFLDKTDKTAATVGAVNTVRIERTGKSFMLSGFNTDVTGFYKALVPLIDNHKIRKALILGTGGGAMAVAFVLHRLSVPFHFVSRHPKGKGVLAYDDLNGEIIRDHLLIINATPVGMFPDTGRCPHIPYSFLSTGHILFDLVYNPDETLFLKKGRQKGAVTSNGLKMLQILAVESCKIWQR